MNDSKQNKRPVKRDPSLHAHHRQRMKTRFLKHGLDVFSEHEVMELLLYFVLPQVDTNEIAHRLINKGGSFSGAFQLPYEELKGICGIKDQAATFLKLIPELSRYYATKEAEYISSPGMSYEDIAKLCISLFIGVNNETLVAFYFDSCMHLLERKIVSVGGFHSVSTNINSVFDDMRRINAVNCVLAHNHPTASLVPSADDYDSTIRIQRMFAQLDINLVEHFVISGDTYLGILKFYEDSNKSALRINGKEKF